jgi:hypothetical protein
MENSQGGLKMMTILLFFSILNLVLNIGILIVLIMNLFKEAVE